MNEISIVFPHQLFDKHPAIKDGRDVLIIEDPLFFGDHKYPLNFHKMKLTFHRASMKVYENQLLKRKFNVHYIDYSNFKTDKNFFFNWLVRKKYNSIHYCEVDDYILNKRIEEGAKGNNIKLVKYSNPSFINDHDYLREYFEKKKKYFQHYFYIDQRKKLNILLENGKPLGGKWSLDSENRKSIPKGLEISQIEKIKSNQKYVSEAKEYVDKYFKNNPGSDSSFYLPISNDTAAEWLDNFLESKLFYFGDYQDAIVRNESYLFHSLLSPLLNCGLLTSSFVLEKTLKFIESNEIPLNSVEGFIRQIIGWREFIRAVYLIDGVKQRTSNFWNNKNKIPNSFYAGTTGVVPIDETIKKLLETGYNHHIERLMILGNFMLLCEIHPTEVYKWFMEMYIDSYDWVMVPNVYGMSQFADAGLMSTKPYISSSNYVKKMSDYKSGEWTKIWDSLFWRFIQKHHQYFASNNRTIFIARNLEKMSNSLLNERIETAEKYLESLK